MDLDCDDGAFCDGPETCTAGTCGPGTAPTCGASTAFCDNTLASCVECLSDTDCPDGAFCGLGACQPVERASCGVGPCEAVPAMSPPTLAWLALALGTVAVVTLRRPL